MRPLGRLSRIIFFLVCALGVLLCGCASSSAQNKATAIPAPTPTPCVRQSTTTAEAWASNDKPTQVIGSINGGPEATLSNFVYPLGLPNEGQFGDASLAALAWAPDGLHLAVAVAVNDGPARALFPYILDTTTHVATRVMLPDKALRSQMTTVNRVLAWEDSQTLLIFGGFHGGSGGSAGTVSYRYDITTAQLTPLLGLTTAYEGVVRCSTLFYLEITPLTQLGDSGHFKGSARLHRYDLKAQREIGSPVTLGDTSTSIGAEGAVTLLGWDASPDGMRIAYQQMKVNTDASGQLALSSTFVAANVDGTNATPILTDATSSSPVFLAISPNGKLVAMTGVEPTPAVRSGSMSGGKAVSYGLDTYGPPVWLADSAQFEADGGTGFAPGIERWQVITDEGTTSGPSKHIFGFIPATLP